jgi:hypothetical protein
MLTRLQARIAEAREAGGNRFVGFDKEEAKA